MVFVCAFFSFFFLLREGTIIQHLTSLAIGLWPIVHMCLCVQANDSICFCFLLLLSVLIMSLCKIFFFFGYFIFSFSLIRNNKNNNDLNFISFHFIFCYTFFSLINFSCFVVFFFPSSHNTQIVYFSNGSKRKPNVKWFVIVLFLVAEHKFLLELLLFCVVIFGAISLRSHSYMMMVNSVAIVLPHRKPNVYVAQ